MAAQNNSQLNKCFQTIGTGSSVSDNLNNALFISMCILRDLPQQKNPRVLCRGSSPIFIYSHIHMEIFLFYKMGKKQGNKERVV
jgi:hypothetical protein